MADIAKLLRIDAAEIAACGGGNEAKNMRSAADEIERLRAELAASQERAVAASDMRAALKAVLKHFRHPTSAEAETRTLIEAALAKAEGGARAMTPREIRNLFCALHNMDRWALEDAGLITKGPSGDDRWTRFNSNLTTFVLKLDCEGLEALMRLAMPKPKGDVK